MELISEAIVNGVRHFFACDDMGINIKTFKRWTLDIQDKRKGPTTTPPNKLTIEEKKEKILKATKKGNMDISPSQIGPALADAGIYIARMHAAANSG